MMNYSILNFLEFFGSFGIFIYGMKTMSEGLQKVAGQRLRDLFDRVTKRRVSAIFIGLAIAGLIQSSSATTILVVSFVNAGIISVLQSISVIIGANIGTTSTIWLVALGFDAEITVWVLPLIGVSVPLLFSGIKMWKSYGEMFIGLCLLFIGLGFMKEYVPDLRTGIEALAFLQEYADSGILSMLIFIIIGVILTIVVQSSSVAIGIVSVMVTNGWVPFELAAASVLGANLGTTLTAVLASFVGNVNARRSAFAHVFFNLFGLILGVIFFTPMLQLSDYFVMKILDSDVSVFTSNIEQRGHILPWAMAVYHTIFNVFNAVIFYPFIPQYAKLLEKALPGKTDQSGELNEFIFGKHLIETPELAILEGEKIILKLAKMNKYMYLNIRQMLFSQDADIDKLYLNVKRTKDNNDKLCFELTKFLRDVAQSNSSRLTYNRLMSMQNMLRDFQNIGRVMLQASLTVQTKEDMHITFTKGMQKGLKELCDLVLEAIDLTIENLSMDHREVGLQEVTNLENRINLQRDKLRIKHLERIEKKKDIIESGLLYRNIYSTFEKTADYVYSINELLVGDREWKK